MTVPILSVDQQGMLCSTIRKALALDDPAAVRLYQIWGQPPIVPNGMKGYDLLVRLSPDDDADLAPFMVWKALETAVDQISAGALRAVKKNDLMKVEHDLMKTEAIPDRMYIVSIWLQRA